MTKQEFLTLLENKLSKYLSKNDTAERVNFYSEMIDDKIEEGACEGDAILSIGSVDDIVSQIVEESSLSKSKKKVKERNITNIILLILGFPIWFSLLVTVLVTVFSVVWSVTVSLWSVFVSFATVSLGGVICGLYFIFTGNILTGFALLSCSSVCAGLAIFSFYGCKLITKGAIWISKKTVCRIKNYFTAKEGA